MQFTILMPFRPGRRLRDSKLSKLTQDENFIWKNDDGDIYYSILDQDVLERGIRALSKNSRFKHKILIIVEPDLFFNNKYKDYLSKIGNISFFVSSSLNYKDRAINILGSVREAILSLPDDEVTCFGYNCDVICAKNWDKLIVEGYNKIGDEFVYLPNWVEPRDSNYSHAWSCGPGFPTLEDETTTENIWDKWYKGCCHSRSMKFPTDRNYMVEKDLDDWVEIANKVDRNYILEDPGQRNYAYYAGMIAKNKIFKKASDYLIREDLGAPDLEFDNHLGTKKILVTKSNLFHLHFKCILDDIEIEHE